jgi:hypothetical protein
MNKENPNIKQEEPPSQEEMQRVFTQYNNNLQQITNSKKVINDLINTGCNIYYKYKDYLFPDILQSIIDLTCSSKKVEYLYLIIEIIKSLHSKRNEYSIKKEDFDGFFLYIKEVCRCFYYSINDEFISHLKQVLKDLKKCKIYPDNYIDDLIMEFRLTTEPKITDNIKDLNSLTNLVNNGDLKVDREIIDLYKDIDDLKRTDNNIIRKKLIKIENDMIQKQIKYYNENLKKIKCLNELIELCDNNGSFDN